MTNRLPKWLGKYRWLLILLAVVGLAADQWTKYGMFGWLYAKGDGTPVNNGAFEAWTRVKPWVPRGENHTQEEIDGGRCDVLPGWFGFIAMYNPPLRKELDDDWRNGLQSVSARKLPHVNRGALFGMGAKQDGGPLTEAKLKEQEQQSENANTLFAVISLVAAGGISVWAVLRGHKADAWVSAALGLILGGTVGNMYDRIVFHGVRDFLFFYKIDWPVFNVADVCLVCGAFMLVLHALFVKPPAPAATATATAETPATTPTTAA